MTDDCPCTPGVARFFDALARGRQGGESDESLFRRCASHLQEPGDRAFGMRVVDALILRGKSPREAIVEAGIPPEWQSAIPVDVHYDMQGAVWRDCFGRLANKVRGEIQPS